MSSGIRTQSDRRTVGILFPPWQGRVKAKTVKCEASGSCSMGRGGFRWEEFVSKVVAGVSQRQWACGAPHKCLSFTVVPSAQTLRAIKLGSTAVDSLRVTAPLWD